MPLPHGRQLALVDSTRAPDQQVLTIANADGTVELEIELRDSGPVVRLCAASLAIETAGALSIDCQRFDVRTSEGINLAAGGDLVASAAGDVEYRASGQSYLEGKGVRIRARRGEAQIEAHDDVRLDGERILLNS